MATACHLGICIAVRTTEAVPLVNESQDNESKFSMSSLEKALKLSEFGKKSKQRFLKASSQDVTIVNSRKGTGGNTVPYKCCIVQQSKIQREVVELLRKGILYRSIIIIAEWHLMYYAYLAALDGGRYSPRPDSYDADMQLLHS